MAAEMASAAPGIVNAARLASGLSGLSGRTAASRFASASAISRVCRLAQMPEQLMQPRPLLAYTLSTIRSRYFSQLSTSSSPKRIFEKPGPCACTFALPR